MYIRVLIGVLLPFLGTVVGALGVFFLKESFNYCLKNIICGFAAGVMIAASVWSLLIPAMEYESSLMLGVFGFMPATLGLWCGILFLLIIQKITHNIDENELLGKAKRNLGDNTMLFLSVALHNLPEGMAVGVVLASATNSDSNISITLAIALAIGIAIQNFPEGAIISIPLGNCGMKKSKAFIIGVLSGLVEPVAAALTMLLASFIAPTLPYFLSFAAGAMLYVVVEELIPEMTEGEHSHIGTIFFAIGFSFMMILDVILG